MAEQRILIEGMYPTGSTLPVSGTLTPSGTQSVTTGTTTATTSLTAATTGTGTTVDFGSAKSNITMAILVTGTVSAGVVTMDVSHDGTNWVPDGTVNPATGINSMLTVSAEAWRYARARISTNITGGGSVTCTFMAGG